MLRLTSPRRVTRPARWRNTAFGVTACLAVTAVVVGLGPLTKPAAASTAQFKGVNWADPKDNFSAGNVVPSGLSTSDSYATTYAKASAVIGGFSTNLGANTVRLPVNPYTVSGSWWSSYTGAIDAALAKGFKVILSYWESSFAYDGLIDDTTAWRSMWTTVTNKYANTSLVYFEPMNEPYGYSATAWRNLAYQWIRTYPSIPAGRIFVSGTGYNGNVTTVCSDSRLNGTLLSLHNYGFWAKTRTSYSAWVSDLRSRIGSCASRTVMDEWGALMTTGLNYNGPINSNYFIAYVQAATDVMRTLGIGSVYWPGLRTGDTYSMETLSGSGTNLKLTDTNASGVNRLRWAWGIGSSTYQTIKGVGSGKCLDVPGATTANSTQVKINTCNGGSNQSWLLTPAKTLVVYGTKCLDVKGASTAVSAAVQINDCHGNVNQQWNLNSNGTITSVQSGLCLDVAGAATSNGTRVEMYTCNGRTNQKWTRT